MEKYPIFTQAQNQLLFRLIHFCNMFQNGFECSPGGAANPKFILFYSVQQSVSFSLQAICSVQTFRVQSTLIINTSIILKQEKRRKNTI